MSKPSKKGQNKTPEEIVHQQKLRTEETRQRAFVKDVFYPYLVENSKSIEDAKNLVYACETAVKQAFHKKILDEQTRLSHCQVSVLELESIIVDDPAFDRDKKLIKMFEFESIATASSLLEGMKLALEGFVREECTKRELATLKTTFLE